MMTRKSELVAAKDLPTTFEIATTYHERCVLRAEKYGPRIYVTWNGEHAIRLAPDQRVAILR